MNAILLRITLIEQGRRLVDLHRETKISYNRLVRIVNGYCPARPEEIRSIARVVGLTPTELASARVD